MYMRLFTFTFSVSHDVSTGAQSVEYKSSEKVVYWSVKKMQGGTEHNARLKVECN